MSLYGPVVDGGCRNLGLPPDNAEDVGQKILRVMAIKLARGHTTLVTQPDHGA